MTSIQFSLVEEKINQAYKNNLPFVVFKKPSEKNVICYFQKSNTLFEYTNCNFNGFIFAPFDSDSKSILFPTNECAIYKSEIEINSKKLENIVNELNYNEDANLKRSHINLVDKTIDFIKNGNARKIVLSRTEEVADLDIDLVTILNKALLAYPAAFVYVWFHPKIGCWAGATPETLLFVHNNTFKTISLAGTQNFNNTQEVSWGAKEIDEQKCVTDYILKNVKKTVSEIDCSEPYTVRAGNVLHLRSDISGKLNNQQSIKKLVKLLHPTPAVCGLPRKKSYEYLMQNENYNRGFYTGYLGEISDTACNLFVNLRCMKLLKNKALLYIGGGITQNSNSENEWEETVLKSMVMKKILQ